MICVSNPLHAAQLIQRGKTLASAMNGKATVLWLCSSAYDEMNYAQVQTRGLFESLCEQHSIPLLVRSLDGDTFSHAIADVAQQEGVTQVVIGQSAKSRISLVFGKSTVEELIAATDEIDIHIVHVIDLVKPGETDHEQGVPCSLEKDGDGLRVNLNLQSTQRASGIFFRRSTTDFDHGHCVIRKNGKLEVHTVLDGRVVD